MGRKCFYDNDYRAVAEAHNNMLQQLVIVEPYIEQHMAKIRAYNAGRPADWVSKEQRRNFPQWLKYQNLSADESLGEITLQRLAAGPTSLMTSCLQEIAQKEKTGEFIAKRENDQLIAVLGNPEHSERVRGVSSRTN